MSESLAKAYQSFMNWTYNPNSTTSPFPYRIRYGYYYGTKTNDNTYTSPKRVVVSITDEEYHTILQSKKILDILNSPAIQELYQDKIPSIHHLMYDTEKEEYYKCEIEFGKKFDHNTFEKLSIEEFVCIHNVLLRETSHVHVHHFAYTNEFRKERDYHVQVSAYKGNRQPDVLLNY